MTATAWAEINECPTGRFLNSGPTTVVSDSFNRADSSTSLGSADTGQAWTALVGTWGITSNQAYNPVGGGDNQCTAVVDAGVSDCTVQVTKPNSHDAGFVFRVVDANNYLMFTEAGVLYKRVGGGFTSIATCAVGSDGDVLAAVLSGTSVIVKRNGTQIVSVTESTHQSATKHGLRNYFPSFGASELFDDFTVTVP